MNRTVTLPNEREHQKGIRTPSVIKAALVDISTDPVQQADESITLLTIRERRMLQRIQRLASGLTEKQRCVLQQLRTKKEATPVHDDRAGQTRTIIKESDKLVIG
ncbi:hypothetical protein SK3146_06581 [Paenibacillus konkukensis]|uniref:Uncharacterized protein n=1 Tax=Paenibacillus konkukensis TaxID=2020716 RepID=A0ABY4S1R7_9BACL|nr:hypothetical protein [Paenibacillus konkukensis]UQZ87284.1 hypothetical protein SK3146_06581 [Paenibacillus konkukensis]